MPTTSAAPAELDRTDEFTVPGWDTLSDATSSDAAPSPDDPTVAALLASLRATAQPGSFQFTVTHPVWMSAQGEVGRWQAGAGSTIVADITTFGEITASRLPAGGYRSASGRYYDETRYTPTGIFVRSDRMLLYGYADRLGSSGDTWVDVTTNPEVVGHRVLPDQPAFHVDPMATLEDLALARGASVVLVSEDGNTRRYRVRSPRKQFDALLTVTGGIVTRLDVSGSMAATVVFGDFGGAIELPDPPTVLTHAQLESLRVRPSLDGSEHWGPAMAMPCRPGDGPAKTVSNQVLVDAGKRLREGRFHDLRWGDGTMVGHLDLDHGFVIDERYTFLQRDGQLYVGDPMHVARPGEPRWPTRWAKVEPGPGAFDRLDYLEAEVLLTAAVADGLTRFGDTSQFPTVYEAPRDQMGRCVYAAANRNGQSAFDQLSMFWLDDQGGLVAYDLGQKVVRVTPSGEPFELPTPAVVVSLDELLG